MKNDSKFAKTMKLCAAVFLAATVLFTALSLGIGELFLPWAITFGTFFFHFAMRLLVGLVVPICAKGIINCESRYFSEKKWERKLYKVLKVKTWKDKMPTYDPESYSLEKHSLEEIIDGTCVSELVHLVIAVLSFIPLLFAIPFGEFGVFVCTSLVACLVDLLFLIMQRYNRPRLKKAAMMQKRK